MAEQVVSYVVSIEGQSIPLPEEIAKEDDRVRQALAPFYPDAANAMITRVEKDGVVTINVVKRAGTKGADPLTYLHECQGGKNPAVVLYEELRGQDGEIGTLDPETLLALDERIELALKSGEEQERAVEAALKRLKLSAARPAPVLIQGF